MDGFIDKKPYLLVGSNIRFLAENAVAHGHIVYTIDHYGDWDTVRLAPNKSIMRNGYGILSMSALSDLALDIENRGIIFGSGFENDLAALFSLYRIGAPIGCGAEAIRKSRDPKNISSIAETWKFYYPRTVFEEDKIEGKLSDWLIKPMSSLGGGSVRFANTPQIYSDQQEYYQQYQPGMPSSALVVSSGSDTTVLGIMSQIIGEEDFGACGFRFVGNVYPHPFTKECFAQVNAIAEVLTVEMDLVGLWGFDFVFDGNVVLIEINPRPPAGLGVFCNATFNDLLTMHLDSVAGRESKQAVDPGDPNTYWAQARVFAHQDMIFTDPMGWYTRGARDIPHEGEIIQAGAPILTLEASRGTYKETMDELKERATGLYRTLEESQPAGAL